jgi:hypothetical protein
VVIFNTLIKIMAVLNTHVAKIIEITESGTLTRCSIDVSTMIVICRVRITSATTSTRPVIGMVWSGLV